MSGWVMAVLAGLLLLFLLAILVALLFVFWPDEPKEPERRRKRRTPPQPPIVIRKKPIATNTRKQITGQQPVPLPSRTDRVKLRNKPGIETRRISVDLDAICRITGRVARECGCAECRKMRANVGN